MLPQFNGLSNLGTLIFIIWREKPSKFYVELIKNKKFLLLVLNTMMAFVNSTHVANTINISSLKKIVIHKISLKNKVGTDLTIVYWARNFQWVCFIQLRKLFSLFYMNRETLHLFLTLTIFRLKYFSDF